MQLGHPLFVADYAVPANSAEGNKDFLDRGAIALRGDRQGRPNLAKVFDVLGMNGSGENSVGTVTASQTIQPNSASCSRVASRAVESN